MANGWHRKRLDTPAERQRVRDYNSAEHKRIRAERVAAVKAGRAPAVCSCGTWCDGLPLGPDSRQWHVPHAPDRTYLSGLWRADCNRREAASRGARIRNGAARTVEASPLTW